MKKGDKAESKKMCNWGIYIPYLVPIGGRTSVGRPDSANDRSKATIAHPVTLLYAHLESDPGERIVVDGSHYSA